jgi:PAS domain S-box-containing protein
MIMGRNALIGVWLGSFAANTIPLIDGSMLSVHTGLPNLLVGAFIGFGAMSGAAAGAFLVRRVCKEAHPLQSGRNVLVLVAAGALGGCLISPTFGVLSLSLTGNIPWERFGYSWITWWVGDTTGVLIAAPLFLAWQHPHSFRKNPWRILEAAVLGGTTLLACFFVFFRNTPCQYGLLPLLLWAAFRFGMRGVSTTAAIIALLATIGTSQGSSPFVGETANESLLLLNSFFGVTITCALFLAGMMEERRRADERMRKLNRALRAISECNQALIHATDEVALLNQVCRLVTNIGGYHLAWIGFAEQNEAKTVRPVAQAGFEEGYLEALQVTWADTEQGRGPTGAAIRTGRPCATHAILTNPGFAPWQSEALRRGYASSLALPLKAGNQVLGVLNICSIKPDSFDAEETKLLTDLADDLTYGISALRISAQQNQADAALEESERKYRELVEHANSIILHWTHDGRVTFLNEFGQRFFGYSAEEILGCHVIGTLVPITDSVGHDMAQLIEQICADPAAFEKNVNENVRRNGARAWIAWTNRIVRDAQGQISEILSIGTDITELKHAEEAIRELNTNLEQRVAERTAELAVAKDRAEDADRLKSAFLANMSHELRTPLNSIIGFTGIILQGLAGPLNGEQQKQLEMVRTSARHLLALINDVLDISKIEAGQMEVNNQLFDLRASIVKVADIVKPLAEKKGLSMHLQLAPEIGSVVSDPRRVEQVLLNLLNNAIKFTEQGYIAITAEIAHGAPQAPDSAIKISVTDTGIGIKGEDLNKLFQPFRQIDTGLSRQHEGTGLGLAICRRLAGLLGGEILAKCEWGKGSVFTLNLPMKDSVKS